VGAVGQRIEKNEQVKSILSQAFQEKGHPIIEAAMDPNEHPFPTRLEIKKVENFVRP
jgi:thiamine pyrophosphate-dependent acetolactate synthase large subunit-like protein